MSKLWRLETEEHGPMVEVYDDDANRAKALASSIFEVPIELIRAYRICRCRRAIPINQEDFICVVCRKEDETTSRLGFDLIRR